MKIRQGFVSNSSTSSFCIYGCEVPDSFIAKLRALEDDEDNEEETDIWVLVDEFNKSSDTKLSYYDCDGYDHYIGVDAMSFRDNETGRQFKDRCQEAVQKFLGETIACGFESGEFPC